MAGEWIKMRTNLWDDPRVSCLCDLTGCAEAPVIGALYWLWATADDHSADGVMLGLTPAGITRKTGVSSFGPALVQIGWIEEIDGGIRIFKFDDHNGASAKSRAQTAKRVANHRGNSDVTHAALQDQDVGVTGALAREDKRREDKEESVVHKGESDANASAHPPASRSERSRASRLPADWLLPKTWGDWALAERPDWNADHVRKVAEQFRDHWLAEGGAKARKADWEATWRNWVRREKSLSGAANRQTGAASANKQEALEARNRAVAERLARECA